MKFPVSKRVTVVLIAILVYSGFIFFPDNILSWDVFGYYLYLPLTFIYHDLGLNNENIIHEIIDKYHNSATFYQAIKLPAGNYVMKYSMGMSILYSPFFFIGHLYAKLSSYPADGFSLPYQYAVFFCGQVFTVTGIVVLRKVLIRFAFSGKKSVLLDSSNIYSPVIEASYREITDQDHAWIRACAYIYPTGSVKTNSFSFVIHFEHNGYAYKYKAFDSEKMNLKLNEWNRIYFDYLTPEVRRKTDNLKVYSMN